MKLPLRGEHAQQILTLFERRGDGAYFGEAVSQTEHALQAAHLATRAGAPDALILAALLHDIGHLLHDLPENIADSGTDAQHEIAGHRWLARRFGNEIAEPVRLHVDAKRYLCRADSTYFATLSPASVRSLELQGGPFTDAQAREFESNAYFNDAVRLRRWDDEAKIPGLSVPPLEAYLDRA